MIKYSIIQCYEKERWKSPTYSTCWLLMVWSRPHHLKHQWSPISTFVSLNHIHHYTYFKRSYVHIQVFHILHHHRMKLLQAFESFMPRRSIIEIGSENWLAAARTVREWKLVCCRLTNSAAKTVSLLVPQFRQWMLICCRQLNSGSKSQIHCRQLNSGSESQIRCRQYNFGNES
jgi:hypothetical protein